MGERDTEHFGSCPNLLGKAAESLKEIAGYTPGYGYTKRAIAEASRRTGLTHSRTFDLWYGKARRVEQYELDAISEALDKKQKEANRNELHELRTRLARLESLLVQTDPDFHRPQIDPLRSSHGGLGGMARPLAVRKT